MGIGGSVSRHPESFPLVVADPKKCARHLSRYFCIEFCNIYHVPRQNVGVKLVACLRIVEDYGSGHY
jgi:hypothetical protein